MAKTIKINEIKINECFSINYSSREADSGDTVMDCNINFDNPKDNNVVVTRLNTWLKSINCEDIVVTLKGSK
jgi:hypothetical protein